MKKGIPAGKTAKAGNYRPPKKTTAIPGKSGAAAGRKGKARQAVSSIKAKGVKSEPDSKGRPVSRIKTSGNIGDKKKPRARKPAETEQAVLKKGSAVRKTRSAKEDKTPKKARTGKTSEKSKGAKSSSVPKRAAKKATVTAGRRKAQAAKKPAAPAKGKSQRRPRPGTVLSAPLEVGQDRTNVEESPSEGGIPSMTLPSGYGENEVSLLVVNPTRVFAFWEMREDTLRNFQGRPGLRIYDVTEAPADKDAGNFIDVGIETRIGDRYIRVSPGRQYLADIGVLYSHGIFIGLARSLRISTPLAPVSEEAFPECASDKEPRVGY